MATSNQKIRYDIEAAVSGSDGVAKLERELDRLANTLEGDLAASAQQARQELTQALESAAALQGVKRLEQGVSDASKEFARARAEMIEYGEAMRAAGVPTAATIAREQQLTAAVSRADQVLKGKRATLAAAQTQLAQYGLTADRASEGQRRISAAIESVESRVRRLNPAYAAAAAAAEQSGTRQAVAVEKTEGRLAGLNKQLATLRNLAGVALGGTVVGSLAKDVAATADEYSNLAARVKLATGEGEAFTQGMADVQRIAQSTNSELDATATLYTRLVQTGKDAGLSAKDAQTEAASLTEVINQSIQLSGASSQAAQAAVTQLIQGLQSGVLRGEEFNSVVEQSPRLARALADGLGVTIGRLREMAQQGQITTEVLKGALGGQAQAIAAEFEKLPPTIGRAMQSLSNAWTVYIGEADKATGASRAVADAIAALARNLDTIAGLLLDAGQAAAAFTALRLAQTFLAIGAAGNTAAAGIGAATLAMNAAGASAATSGAAVAATAGRIATVLRTLRTFTLVGLLVNIKDLGTALGEGVAKLVGYRNATEDLAEAEKRSAVAAQESTRMKAALAQEIAKLADATRGLTPAARELVAEFDKATASGKGVAEALSEISKNSNLSDTQGIAAFTIALRDMATQGKASADEVRDALAQALKGEDLQAFEVRARTAFAGAKNEAELLALAMDAQLRAAVERTGLSFGRITSGMSDAARSAINDTESIINGMERLEEQGADVALALTASIGKGINTADSQKAFELLRQQIEAVRKVLGDQVADAFLRQIEEKASAAAREVGGLTDALSKLGITSDADLKRAADATRKLYEEVRNAGGSAREQAEAFRKMAEAAIASGDGAALSYAKSQAAVQGFEIATDSAGRTVVRTMAEAEAAAESYRKRMKDATGAVQEHVGWLERMAKRNAEVKSSIERDWEGFAVDEKGNRIVQSIENPQSVAGRLEGMGVDPEQARRVAASMFDAKGNYAPRSSGAWQEGDTMDATLARLAQRGAGAASVGRNVNVNLTMNGTTRTVPTTEEGAQALVKTLQVAQLAAGR